MRGKQIKEIIYLNGVINGCFTSEGECQALLPAFTFGLFFVDVLAFYAIYDSDNKHT